MKTMKRIVLTAGLIFAAVALIGCNMFGGTTVSGTASKGPINGADISVFALQADGSIGTLLGTTASNESGDYSVAIGDYNGPYAVVAERGSYKDEASGQTVTLGEGQQLVSYIESTEDNSSIAVTALTTIAAARASELASDGLNTAIDQANRETAEVFGLGTLDISRVVPADLSGEESSDAGDPQKKYGAVQAGLSKFVEQEKLNPDQLLVLVADMANDFASGEFNGLDAAGQSINFVLEIAPQTALSGLETALNAFLKSEENRSGLLESPISVPAPRN